MQRDIFAGNIVLFYAYDIGDDIDLERIKSQHLVPTYNTPLSAKFKNYHVPLTYHLKGDGIISEGETEEKHKQVLLEEYKLNERSKKEGKSLASYKRICYVLSKIHAFGVLSFCYRIPFEGTFHELKKKVIELKSEYDQLSDI